MFLIDVEQPGRGYISANDFTSNSDVVMF